MRLTKIQLKRRSLHMRPIGTIASQIREETLAEGLENLGIVICNKMQFGNHLEYKAKVEVKS